MYVCIVYCMCMCVLYALYVCICMYVYVCMFLDWYVFVPNVSFFLCFVKFTLSQIQKSDAPEREKSKKEIMSEIITKSKMYRQAKQDERARLSEETEKVDETFDQIAHLVFGGAEGRVVYVDEDEEGEGEKEV